MAKKYRIKPPNRKILKKYWNALEILEGRYYEKISDQFNSFKALKNRSI